MKHEIYNRYVCHQLCIRQFIAYSVSQFLNFQLGILPAGVVMSIVSCHHVLMKTNSG